MELVIGMARTMVFKVLICVVSIAIVVISAICMKMQANSTYGRTKKWMRPLLIVLCLFLFIGFVMILCSLPPRIGGKVL